MRLGGLSYTLPNHFFPRLFVWSLSVLFCITSSYSHSGRLTMKLKSTHIALLSLSTCSVHATLPYSVPDLGVYKRLDILFACC
jgi:hypothetical protein